MASSSLSDHEDDLNGRPPFREATQRPLPSSRGSHSTHQIQLFQGTSLRSFEADTQYVLSAERDRVCSDHDGISNLPSSLLEDISHSIRNRKEGVRLAVKLKLDDDRVTRMLDEDFTSETPFRVLYEWVDKWRHRATGAVLYCVLHEIDRPDIADSFVHELLGEDEFLEDGIAFTTSQQMELNAGATISQLIPSLDVLQEIARYIPKRKHCVRLAEKLELEEDFVRQVEGGEFTDDVMALKVLCKWRDEKSTAATGRALYDALAETLRDAVCFAEMLLGEENEDWEDVGYDDSHRDFFQLLKRQHVDILAAYERMCCSEEFLHALHNRHVLSAPEYEDLLECSQVLPRPAMNKKLLDVVNGKLQQLQQIFCELLYSYQRDLVVFERGTLRGSSEVLGDGIAQSDIAGSDLLADLQEQLKRWFKQLIIAKPLDFLASQDAEPVDNVYVTLSSISYDEAAGMISGQRQLSKSELINAATKVHAESEHSKELLSLHSLLSYSEDVCAKSALLFGEAGSGKSLSALKILSEWSRKESTSPFKQFDLIVYVTGRERARLQATEVSNFWQLWKYGYTEHQQDYILNYYAHHSEKVLFLIDAWDESGSDGILEEDTVVKQILRNTIFRTSSVIVTSRPASNAYPLLKECHRRYTLVGFKNKRLRELFDRRLGVECASQLFTLLSQSSHVHVKSAVQKTPLFACMLVQLYKMEKTVPTTVTALYQALLESIQLRYLEQLEKLRTDVDNQSEEASGSRTSLKGDFDQAETLLSELALTGLMNNRMSFTQEEVKCFGRAVTERQFGLLCEVKEFDGVHGSRVLYFFSHLTWQEFLAARCLATDPNFVAKLKMCVRSIGVSRHTHLFWRFLAGLIDSQHLMCLVFELASTGGVSGVAPWETEMRLFLLECVAESMRMRQICGEELSLDQYVNLTVYIISSCREGFNFIGCILDSSHLSSVTLVLKACPMIVGFRVRNCRIDEECPALSDTLCHIEDLGLAELVGEGVSSMVMNVCDSASHVVRNVQLANIIATTDCLRAIANLINNSKSLTCLTLFKCSIGIQGIAYLHGVIRHSSALEIMAFKGENFSGCGGYLGKVCARMSRLQSLYVKECSLNDNDFAKLLAGLESSCYLHELNVTNNLLTDAAVFWLKEYAVQRQKSAPEVQAQLGMTLPELTVYLNGNNLSEETLTQLAYQLPMSCGVSIQFHDLLLAPNHIQKADFSELIREQLASSGNGELGMVSTAISDSQAKNIACVISEDYSKLLKSLYLWQCEITDGGAAAIASVLPLNKLQALDLSQNKITFIGFQHLLSASSASSSLQYLNVGQNPIFSSPCSQKQSQEATASILSLSMSIHHLRIVSVSGTQFSDELTSFENSPIALLAIPSLSALDLSSNEITDNSVPMVTEWMDKVGFLSLSGNRICSDGAKAIIQKAESLAESADKQQPSTLRLQRVWLGGNSIERSMWDDCSCEIMSSDSFTIENMKPCDVLLLFSEQFNTVHDAQSNQPHVKIPGCLIRSPFWVQMMHMVTSGLLADCMESLQSKTDLTSFNYWITTACQILAFGDDNSHDAVRQAHALIDIFELLSTWYTANCQNKSMSLVIWCCIICVCDELVVRKILPPSLSQAEECMGFVANLAAQDDELLLLAVQTLSGLAERCQRKHLHTVADQLLQRLEYLCPYC